MRLSPEELEARILREADGLLAVDKCPDLPTSGRSLEDPDCLQHHLIERHGGMVWAVHQLDADTSGVNLFTTRRALVEPLKRALGHGTKRYLAVVHGVPEWTSTRCDAALGVVGPRGLGVTPTGRSARTDLRVVASAARHALVEARPRTGRTHQLRLHLAHLGHPLVGEEWYCEPPCIEHRRQALHAARVTLQASATLELRAPLPADLAALIERLGLPHAD